MTLQPQLNKSTALQGLLEIRKKDDNCTETNFSQLHVNDFPTTKLALLR